jgi:hypothetical protein
MPNAFERKIFEYSLSTLLFISTIHGFIKKNDMNMQNCFMTMQISRSEGQSFITERNSILFFESVDNDGKRHNCLLPRLVQENFVSFIKLK